MFDQPNSTSSTPKRRARGRIAPSRALRAILAAAPLAALAACSTPGETVARPDRLTEPLLPSAGTVDGSGSEPEEPHPTATSAVRTHHFSARRTPMDGSVRAQGGQMRFWVTVASSES